MKQNLYALVLAPAFKMSVNGSRKYKSLRRVLFINLFTLLIMMTAGNINADTVKKRLSMQKIDDEWLIVTENVII